MAFIALAPFFVALSGWRGRTPIAPGAVRPIVYLPGAPARRGFTLGLITGIAYFGGTVYWTSETVHTFGGLPLPIAIVAAAILVMYLALFPAMAGAAGAVLIRRFGATGLMLAPSAWVSAEYLRGYLFGGFPWIPLGNAMAPVLPILQGASVAGVYGLSWLLAMLHACLALAMMSAGPTRISAAVASLVIVAGPSLWGAARINEGHLVRDGSPVRVGLVQGNIAQGEKWEPGNAATIYERYLTMTRQAAAKGAQFVIWPESATPFFFEEDPYSAERLRALVRETGAPILFGSDQIERAAPADRYYNAAFILDRAGSTAAVYRKIFLVPFGEYVPFRSLLFFVGPLVEAVGSFVPGQQVTMLPVDGHMSSTAICYEVVYPQLIRQAVLNGSELLTTITNDAWYGETSAPFQHFQHAIVRAAEQGRYMARAANTGISGIIDPYGRVLVQTNLFETMVVVGEARFLQERTVYARIGDVVPQAAVLMTLLALGAALVPPRPWRFRVTRPR